MPVDVLRLGAGDAEVARRTFAVMAAVFEEPSSPLSDAYLQRLLARDDFWGFAARVDGAVVGGLTAHTIHLTRVEARELFIFDLAVSPDHQRQGIGRALVDAARHAAHEAGVDVAFVPADDEDTGAIEFYRAIGGSPTAVTFFTFEAPESS